MKITHTQVCTLLHAAADLLPEPDKSELMRGEAFRLANGASLVERVEGIVDILVENYPLGAHEAGEPDNILDWRATNSP